MLQQAFWPLNTGCCPCCSLPFPRCSATRAGGLKTRHLYPYAPACCMQLLCNLRRVAGGHHLAHSPNAFYLLSGKAAILHAACPTLARSIAGNMRFSLRRRSRWISMLPVPLNSSYIISSMREPVSTSAVAMMVRLPPFSMLLRRAEKSAWVCTGNWDPGRRTAFCRMAAQSGCTRGPAWSGCPEESPRPGRIPPGVLRVQSPFPPPWRDFPAARRNVEYTTSPLMERCISVTSSGRSSIRRTINSTSG